MTETFDEVMARSYPLMVSRAALADEAYYENDSPIMEDGDYDELKRHIAGLEEQYPALLTDASPTNKVSGKADTTRFAKVTHRQRMESLDNAFNSDDLGKWLEGLGTFSGGYLRNVLYELKMDGLSLELTYEGGKLVQAATRGDGAVGEDVTKQAHHIRDLPLVIPYPETLQVRGECYMSRADFAAYYESEKARGAKKLPANCRNSAAGTLRQTDMAIIAKRGIRFMAFGTADESMPEVDSDADILRSLKTLGFDVVPHHLILGSMVKIPKIVRQIEEERPGLPFDIDGIVWKIDERSLRKELGSTSRAPRWAIAYKFPAERRTTVLKDIVVQTGRTGALTPVAVLEPVSVGGVTITSVTLHNEDEIARLQLVPGATVIVQRAGDVIPQIVGVDPNAPVVKGIWGFPLHCPSCHGETERPAGEAVRRCVNTSSCPAQLQGHLEHFVSRRTMNIDGLGPSQIEDIVKRLGLTKASEFMGLPEMTENQLDDYEEWSDHNESGYCLVSQDMETWPGYGKSSVSKLMKAIKKARSPDLQRFIYALGIRNVGEGTSKDLASHLVTVAAFFDCITYSGGFAAAGVGSISGIGPVVMASLDAHFANKVNYDEAYALRLVCNIKDMPSAKVSSVQPLAGEVVCFTGSMDRWSRDQCILIAAELGAKTTNSASKSTTILVTGGNVGAKKVEAAQKNGTNVIPETDFIAMVEAAIEQGYKLDVMD